MNTVYAREPAPLAILDELRPLLEQHWREIAAYPDIPLAPDLDLYRRVEQAGQLRCYTARHAGQVVGYAVFSVRPHPHYCTSLQADQDVFFVEPTRRGRFVGLRLIRFADEQLAAEGVQVVRHHVKVAHPALGELLTHAGYAHVESIHQKRLDRPREVMSWELP